MLANRFGGKDRACKRKQQSMSPAALDGDIRENCLQTAGVAEVIAIITQ